MSDQYVPLAVQRQDGSPLCGRIVAHGVGSRQLRSLRASAHVFDRTPQLLRRSADEYYRIALVASGSSVLCQDDREVALTPGCARPLRQQPAPLPAAEGRRPSAGRTREDPP